MKIGVIAEAESDVDVLYKLTCKLIDVDSFSFKKFVGHGCGKLRRKCAAWADNLLRRGCSYLVVIHDLDDYDQEELQQRLASSIAHAAYSAALILIPVRELEAWLLTDSGALKKVFSLPERPELPGNPEDVLDPKKKLRDIIWKCGRKNYVNTIHNAKIADAMSIVKAQGCKSFRPYPVFVAKHLTN